MIWAFGLTQQVSVLPYLVVLAAGAKAKDEQVSMGVGGCKMLPIWTTFAVKQRSVPLALNLSTERGRYENRCTL